MEKATGRKEVIRTPLAAQSTGIIRITTEMQSQGRELDVQNQMTSQHPRPAEKGGQPHCGQIAALTEDPAGWISKTLSRVTLQTGRRQVSGRGVCESGVVLLMCSW